MNPIRADFPILSREHRGTELVYLDSAATTQKPRAVIDAISSYYEQHNANVHRAAHLLAEEATTLMEDAREATRAFIGAPTSAEVIFTRGTTESINLIANCLTSELQPGDEILLTELEHHSNIVPWQLLAQRTGATVVAVCVTPNGELDLEDFYGKLSDRTRIFACNHVSNALGTVNPIAELVQAAAEAGALTVVDGAQAVLHKEIDVVRLNCDFYAFSGHKLFGPTGIGVLYGKRQHLDRLPPWQGGGEMIERVTLKHSTWQQPPYKFEAGTPNIAGAVGLGAAIKYLQSIDRPALVTAESELIHRTITELKQVPGLRIVGDPVERSAVISFLMEGAHPHDVGTLLDQQGVALRTGHHCTMPLMDALDVPGTIRASFSLYSNQQDAQRLVEAVQKASSFL